MIDYNDFYKRFQDRYRGPRGLIKSRVSVYLPDVSDACRGDRTLPILDLGCGRGEWLEVLKANGYACEGVDLNVESTALPIQMGIHVHNCDVMTFLQSCPPDYYAVISAFHLIEHLDFDNQVQLFEHVFRALRPGGIMILEWPNPENLKVATQNFWLDPTHIRLLPIELVSFTAEYIGFRPLRTLRSNSPASQSSSTAKSPSLLSRIVRRIALGSIDRTVVDGALSALHSGMDIGLIVEKPMHA